MDHFTAALEREVQYYRRECNELGARLLRMQEEQSLAHREARRSKTVAKLLREAYRLGDVSGLNQDLGIPVLELIVDNVLCDRAALLREEPVGSGQFLISHAVGLAEESMNAVVRIAATPRFSYTTEHEPVHEPVDRIVAAVGVPYVLWAYDRGSGLALVIGNRVETNVNRPFESGDETLIEGALSVYVDLLYRKHVALQLRQAKQVADAASVARATLSQDLFDAVDRELQQFDGSWRSLGLKLHSLDTVRHLWPEISDAVASFDGLRQTVRRALGQASEAGLTTALAYEWVCIDDLVRAAMRPSYASNIRRGVEIDCSLPRRRVAICADRLRIQQVIQDLIELATEGSVAIGTVRVLVSRRSDGGLDLVVAGQQALSPRGPPSLCGPSERVTGRLAASRIETVRTVMEEHGGTFTLESSSSAGVFARAVFPSHGTRDIELASG